jgi:hypothetical protein
MSESQGRGRGPDPIEVSIQLAFQDQARNVIGLWRLRTELFRLADSYNRTDMKIRQLTNDGSFDREIDAVLAMRGGIPFWDRPPIEA